MTQPKQPFKVGDRVAFYTRFGRSTGTIASIPEPDVSLRVAVNPDKDESVFVHPKQCRRLKPKRERRRVWICVHKKSGYMSAARSIEPSLAEIDSNYDIVEFIEVPKKAGAR